MAFTSRIAKIVAILCLLWLVSFPVLGGGAWGHDTFGSWAGKSFLQDKKGGVPILMLTFPILVAASTASIFTTTTNDLDRSRVPPKKSRFSSAQRRLPEKQTVLLWLLLCLPCLVYVVSTALRKLSFDMSLDKALMKSGNMFGMLAVVVFSWMLLPVLHRGPLERLFRWDSIAVIRFHIWSGRIIVVAATLHGLEHTIRYALQGKDVFRAFYLPPLGCWKNPQTYVPEICDKADDDEPCSCYDHFLPISGMTALTGLILIGFSSMYKIRRKNFAFFAKLHYVLTPLTFLAVCIHYNKSILYASGSLLYYLACNIPAWVENSIKKKQRCGGQSHVRVLAVEKLHSDGSKDNPQRPCVALTMEATEASVQQFYPGAYVDLSVPSISSVSHPFTVNRVIGQTNQIRVIFRATGPFTRALDNALFFPSPTTVPLMAGDEDDDEIEQDDRFYCENNSSGACPKLFLDGYYGSGRLRSRVLSHDVCVLVAAGIGITPYLSLLSELSSTSHSTTMSDGLMADSPNFGEGQQPEQVVLHWICRDKSVIDYCRKEYMEGTNEERGRCSVKVIIHKTGGEDDVIDGLTPPPTSVSRADTSQCGGGPFEISKFTVGESLLGNIQYFVLFSALAWGGLVSVWLSYEKQSTSEYIHRIYSLATVMIYELTVSVLANALWYFCSRRSSSSSGLEKISDIELSTYRDQHDFGQPDSVPDVPGKAQTQHSSMAIEVSDGRPLLEDILDDLHVEKSCAVFCCLPEHMSKNLRDCIYRKSIFDARYNNIRIYKESFEK